jgi:hypothetical protein
LQGNCTRRYRPGAVREGKALLKGIVLCGHCGKNRATSWLAVAYPWAADKYLRPLANRLSSVNQPVMLTRNAFSTPRPTPWACL